MHNVIALDYESQTPTISLKVQEADANDVGRNVARIDEQTMNALGVSHGFILELRGKSRATVAKGVPISDPSDEGKEIIRLDGLTRNNASAWIGDMVSVRRIRAWRAEKVVLMPQEAILNVSETYIAKALESVPVITGDAVMVPYFGGYLTFIVAEVTSEKDAVITESSQPLAALITSHTQFIIRAKEKRIIKMNIMEYVRQDASDIPSVPLVNEPRDIAKEAGAPFFLGLRIELFVGVIVERIDFQKRISNERLIDANDMQRFAQNYIGIAMLEVNAANKQLNVTGNNLHEPMLQAEKAYPSSALLEKESDVRQFLQELKYRIVKKWTEVNTS